MSPVSACVIGAGSSGITALKALLDKEINADCFEQTEHIGGLWAFGSSSSAAYRTLHINSYRREMSYADFPMPETFSDFPHHSEILRYFNDYVDHFGLRSHIQLGTAVEHIEPLSESGFEVRLTGGDRRHYDAVLVANGHHAVPRWPEPAPPGRFEGHQMHSHDYREMAELAGHRVVVVGMGNSAMDIAVESSYVADRTYLSTRRGAYVIPKHLFGYARLPIPIGDRRLPWRVRQFLLQQTVRLAVGRPERYGLPAPAHKILQTHPTVSDTLLSRLSHGAIIPKPSITELCGRTVRFSDSSVVEADVIVYCTGYRITFPFLDTEVMAATDNRLPLYIRVFPPELARLSFIGFIQPWGSIMPIAEAQSKLVADQICGDYALPDLTTMRRAIARQDEQLARRYVASRRHTIQVDAPVYLHELAVEHAAGRRRARQLARL